MGSIPLKAYFLGLFIFIVMIIYSQFHLQMMDG